MTANRILSAYCACLLLTGWLTTASNARAQDPADPLAPLRQLFDERNYDAVIERGEALLATLQDDPATAGKLLDLLVYAARLDGRSSDPHTQELARLAIETNEATFGNPSAEMAASLSGYALVLGVAGDLEGAREQHTRALKMREIVLGPNDPNVARTASNLGDILSRLARYDEATASFEHALSASIEAYGPKHLEVAKVYHNMGNNLLRGGDYTAAREAYERSLTMKEELLGPDDAELAYTLISLGVLENTTGNYEDSRRCYERALEICETALGDDNRLTLTARGNLANLLNDQGDYDAAVPLYERTLAMREAQLGPDHPEVAETRHNIGVLLLRAEQPERAKEYFESALAIFERRFGADHPSLAGGNESLANIALAEGDTGEALRRAETALRLRSNALGADHPDAAMSRLQVGAIHLARGERAEALHAISAASRAADQHLRETIAYMPERQALAMVDVQIHPENVLFSGLLGAESDRGAWLQACWEWTLRRRGIVQEELARRARNILNGDTPETREAWAAYAAARAKLGEIWVEGPTDDAEGFASRMSHAREEKEAAEFALARISAEFRRDHAPVTLDSLAAALEGSDRLVEFVRVSPGWPPEQSGPARDFALFLAGSGETDFVDLGESAAVDAATQSWRVALDEAALARGRAWEADAAMQRLDVAGRALRRLVWDPLLPHIGDPEHLYVVPEGGMHLVDLGALPFEDGRFLIEGSPSIRLLDRARDLARFARSHEPSNHRSVLAIGNVDFDATGMLVVADNTTSYRGPATACVGFEQMQWPPLPESRQELDTLEEIFPDADILSGADATVGRLQSEARGKGILHLATHGFFLQGRCATADDQENPLLLSGLVFAGANRSGGADDGIATAEELAAMDLRGVDLTVLSACDTGRGEIAVGEGVFGLRRAFDVAGSSTVVMSLWPVPDDATRAWMSFFYHAIRDGKGASDAAREASRERLRALREAGVAPHPELWAGFIAVGDWN